MEEFRNKIKAGDVEAVKMAQLVYTNEVLIDMFESIAIDITQQSKKCGLHMKKTKQVINKYMKAAHNMAHDQHRYIGKDEHAERFGDVADFLSELIIISIFLPEESRIKLISTAKILNKNAKINTLT